MSTTLYDKDFYRWALEQAHYIKTKAFDKLDIEHLFDEVEDMGKHEKRELENRLEVLLTHLLKWKYQPNLQSRSWRLTIKEQRSRIKYHLEDNPSLRNHDNIQKVLSRSYDGAIYSSIKETGLSERTFPQICEWSLDQILDNEFYPN